jgi:hypothetical protein
VGGAAVHGAVAGGATVSSIVEGRIVEGRIVASAHVRHQHHSSTKPPARSRQGTDIAHESMLPKGGFHRVELDAGTPDLDLPVLAAEPFQ